MVLRWCENRRSCYFFIHNQLHAKNIVESNKKAIAFHWHSNHFYLYNNAIWCAQSAPRDLQAPPSIKLLNTKRGHVPLYSEWQSQYAGKAGFYKSINLEETRQELYDIHRIIPRLTLDHKARLTKLRVQCEDGPAVFLQSLIHI